MGILLVSLILAIIEVVVYKIKFKKDIKFKFCKYIGYTIAFLVVDIIIVMLVTLGIAEIMKKQYTDDIISEQYELISFNTIREYKGEIDGNMFLLCGSISGEIGSTKNYEFWYIRQDGGLVPGAISSDDATIVVYETNEIKPKFVVYEGLKALPENFKNRWIFELFSIDKSYVSDETEYRFYVPVGTFWQQGSYEVS